jgi:hypothetical protein
LSLSAEGQSRHFDRYFRSTAITGHSQCPAALLKSAIHDWLPSSCPGHPRWRPWRRHLGSAASCQEQLSSPFCTRPGSRTNCEASTIFQSVGPGRPSQLPSLMPASLITFAHSGVSFLMIAVNSAGVLPTGSRPRSSRTTRRLSWPSRQPDDAALNEVPLLQHAAQRWLDLISVKVRHCIICSSWIANRQSVGALLLSMPVVARPHSASVCGVCRECWDADLGLDALERAATTALREAVPNGRFY